MLAAAVFPIIFLCQEKENVQHKPGASPDDSPLYSFVSRHLMSDDGGVYTNLRTDLPKQPDTARNHDQLSESTGLLMEYALLSQKKDLFDHQVYFLDKNLVSSKKWVKWMVGDEKKGPPVNASIDDLRIAHALIQAGQKWGNPEYKKLGMSVAEGLIQGNASGPYLADYYNWEDKKKGDKFTSSYLDLKAMRLLAEEKPADWKKVYESSRTLLQEAQLPSGLYRKTYKLDSKQWLPDGQGYNLIDSLLAALHASEDGLSVEPTLSFLHKAWNKDGVLYGTYKEDGQTLTENESPAVYAIAVRLLRLQQDPLAEELKKRMGQLSVQDSNSPYYGGFLDTNTLECYSFDQLQALLVERE
ncbi:endo-1,4-D-glucanase [Paenibacillus larvae subsp. larvae]|uniref:Endo-1,4-D-glucanase n=1 Tax=Paenibacillus larvae subsp. larvae TaxID=147375 RepID=A0A2L1UHD7_9BACL|nr:endo-1,4-D-glucanase [Paenibacillus larvae subsp. larvae]AVF32343.1 endo-1,4-D-glucanase [Paenibacillus larvae subsp. larvae]MBH0341508.1 hypothetical protein [Paenibacillus larvae]